MHINLLHCHIDGAWLCMGLLMDFQGLSMKALLFLVTFVMESNSVGCHFVSEVIRS